ncbi:hypothetical protein G4B88_024985 [Cannabis sativa]|uniref:Dirigent protein n=1 Tax=Cannabis sativa TaxID=3483 RepID=A0A7J6EBK6_CANSA|nr:hypothetical protein G4B88_024985 [Cannabis sativa]
MRKDMSKLSCITLACMILLLIFNQSSSTRTLGNSVPNPTRHNYNHNHHKITFLMRDIFNVTTSTKLTSTTTNDLPFSKPLGLIPPKDGVRVPSTESFPRMLSFPGLSFPMARATLQQLEFGTVTPIKEGIYNSDHSHHHDDSLIPPKDGVRVPSTESFPQMLSFPGLSFPMARATLQELEFGTVTPIEEGIYNSDHSHHHDDSLRVVIGKAQGIYVATSEGGISSHMMALTASFGDGDEANGLRFFGVRKKGVTESHIAVIGGVGKYQGANGYATLKRVNINSQKNNGVSKLFKFSVYLS